MRQQDRIQADGTEEISGDGGFRSSQIDLSGEQVLGAHDSGAVEHDIEFWETLGDIAGEGLDRRGILDIEYSGLKARICCGVLVKDLLAAPSDDHLISEFVKCLRKCPANAGASTCNEDRVACGLHRIKSPWF